MLHWILGLGRWGIRDRHRPDRTAFSEALVEELVPQTDKQALVARVVGLATTPHRTETAAQQWYTYSTQRNHDHRQYVRLGTCSTS